MNSLNQVIVEGNVVRVPEKKDLSSGSQFCMVPLAVNRKYKAKDGQDTEEVSYFDVETYGNLADVCAKWCPKGRGVRVVGRLKQNRWKSDDGKNHSKVTIVAEHVEFKPFFKKNEDGASADENGPASADSTNASVSKKQKLAMLKEAAEQTQLEQESGEVVF